MRHCDVAVGPCRVLHPGPAASRSPSSPHPYRSSTDPLTHRNTTPRRAVATSSGRPKPKRRHRHPSRRTSAGPCPAGCTPLPCVQVQPSPDERLILPVPGSHIADPRAQERDALPLPPFRPARRLVLRVPPVVALARPLDTWTQATVEWSSVKKKLDLVARGKVFLQTEASRSRATRAVDAGLELAAQLVHDYTYVRMAVLNTGGGSINRDPLLIYICAWQVYRRESSSQQWRGHGRRRPPSSWSPSSWPRPPPRPRTSSAAAAAWWAWTARGSWWAAPPEAGPSTSAGSTRTGSCWWRRSRRGGTRWWRRSARRPTTGSTSRGPGPSATAGTRRCRRRRASTTRPCSRSSSTSRSTALTDVQTQAW